LWSSIFALGLKIVSAHTSFKWSNLAAHNAGIIVVIVGIVVATPTSAILFEETTDGVIIRLAENINGYLSISPNIFIHAAAQPISNVARMNFGNHPYYASALIVLRQEARKIIAMDKRISWFVRPYYESKEVINATPRICLWVRDNEVE